LKNELDFLSANAYIVEQQVFPVFRNRYFKKNKKTSEMKRVSEYREIAVFTTIIFSEKLFECSWEI
jgi:hypothetical protein